jgi:hypothetical protein
LLLKASLVSIFGVSEMAGERKGDELAFVEYYEDAEKAHAEKINE